MTPPARPPRCSPGRCGVHTHIGGVPHPARRGLDLRAGAGDHAAGPQRRRQDDHAAHHHGPVAASAGRGGVRRAPITARHARHARPASPTCPRTWASSPTSRCKENMLLAARRAEARRRDRQRAWNGSSASFPALKKFWNHPAGNTLGGQKQMLALPAPSSSRAPAPDRRAQQGPGAGHHQQHDRRLDQLKRRGTTILLVEQNFRSPKRWATRGGDGQRPRGARRAMRSWRTTKRCSSACWAFAGSDF